MSQEAPPLYQTAQEGAEALTQAERALEAAITACLQACASAHAINDDLAGRIWSERVQELRRMLASLRQTIRRYR